MLSIGGCPLLRGTPPPPTAPPPAPVDASGLSISALPVYRLVADPALLDAPSRLLVLHVRLETTDERPSTVWPENSLLTLPGGQHGRVFDRGRAMELLRRTTLADANLAYLQRVEGYQPGGFDVWSREQLVDMIMANLLSEGALTKATGVRGYVVADVHTPMSSLHGATLDYWAYPLDDSQPAHARYAFGGVEAATATPAVAVAAVPAAATPVPAVPAAVPVPVPDTPAPTEATPAPAVKYLFELAEPTEEAPSATVSPAAAGGDTPAAAPEAAQPGAAVEAPIEPAVTPAPPVEAAAPPSDGTAPILATPAAAVETAVLLVPTATPLPLETPAP
jgi:hypothetical protein